MEEGYLSHAPRRNKKLWDDTKRIVMSLWFQNIMAVLACTYLIATSIGIVLERRNVRLKTRLVSAVSGINLFTTMVFFVEALVRAKLYRDGIAAYFSNLWNVMDVFMIVISAGFEVIDLLHFLQLKWFIPILATMRLISSLRTVGMLYKKAIDAETLINELLEDTIHQLSYELDIKDSDQARLTEELAAKRKKIRQIENNSQVVMSKMITAQRFSWDNLVPATYGIAAASRPSSKDSIHSFKVVKLH